MTWSETGAAQPEYVSVRLAELPFLSAMVMRTFLPPPGGTSPLGSRFSLSAMTKFPMEALSGPNWSRVSK